MGDKANKNSIIEKIAVIAAVVLALFACIGWGYEVFINSLEDESRITSIESTLADVEGDVKELKSDLKEIEDQADQNRDQSTRNATAIDWISKVSSRSSESVQNKVDLMNETEKRELAFSVSIAASKSNFDKSEQQPVTVGNTTFMPDEFIDLVEHAKDDSSQ